MMSLAQRGRLRRVSLHNLKSFVFKNPLSTLAFLHLFHFNHAKA
jgi:hypothetical protein